MRGVREQESAFSRFRMCVCVCVCGPFVGQVRVVRAVRWNVVRSVVRVLGVRTCVKCGKVVRAVGGGVAHQTRQSAVSERGADFIPVCVSVCEYSAHSQNAYWSAASVSIRSEHILSLSHTHSLSHCFLARARFAVVRRDLWCGENATRSDRTAREIETFPTPSLPPFHSLPCLPCI